MPHGKLKRNTGQDKTLSVSFKKKNSIVIEKTVPSATLFINQRDRFSNEIDGILLASFWKVKATT